MPDQTPLVLALAALKRNQFGGSKYKKPAPIFDRIYGQMEIKRMGEDVAENRLVVVVSHPELEAIDSSHILLLHRELTTVLKRRVVIQMEKHD